LTIGLCGVDCVPSGCWDALPASPTDANWRILPAASGQRAALLVGVEHAPKGFVLPPSFEA
jgi:hypothetical protein